MTARAGTRGGWALWLYAALAYLFVYAPVIYLVVFSFNDAAATTPPWRRFTLRWYRAIAERPAVKRGWDVLKEGRAIPLP